MKSKKQQELESLKKRGEQQMKANEEDHKRNMDKYEAEKKKKAEELKNLMETVNSADEKKHRETLSQERQRFNEKINDYDTGMESKIKEREDHKVNALI